MAMDSGPVMVRESRDHEALERVDVFLPGTPDGWVGDCLAMFFVKSTSRRPVTHDAAANARAFAALCEHGEALREAIGHFAWLHEIVGALTEEEAPHVHALVAFVDAAWPEEEDQP